MNALSNLKIARLLAAAAFIATALTAGNGWAQARKTTVTCTESNGSITVSFDIKGVGNGDLCVVSTGTFTTDCACANGGTNCPRNAASRTSPEEVGAGQSFQTTNGQITGSETLAAPATCGSSGASFCSQQLSCPGGQSAVLAELVLPSEVNVDVFAPGTYTTMGCPQGEACCQLDSKSPVTTGSCKPSPASITCSGLKNCASLF